MSIITTASLHLDNFNNFDTHQPPTQTINSPTNMSSEIPNGNAMDNSYQSRTGQSEISVQKDEAPIEATEYDNGGDSDQQLGE